MAIKSINFNNLNRTYTCTFKGEDKQYLKADSKVSTESNIKPLKGKGHLVHDNALGKTKYFFEDIAYDFKSVRNGINGTANDHQLGRLNDVGIKLAGISIAVYLASRTKNPKKRIMEYLGLGAFLTAMNLYPKLFINKPAKLVHGYDIDKWYIDDQGRKKSVFQDSNYIPYDLYRGEADGEDLDEIGDKMGIPRDIHNRHDVIKEQMRKIATQNNTLWMLTAGLATPTLTALGCCGLETLISPLIQGAKNSKINSNIAKIITMLKDASLDATTIKQNGLSKDVESILSEYKGKSLPKEELEKLTDLLTKNLDSKLTQGIKTDLANAFSSAVSIDDKAIEDMISTAKKALTGRNKNVVEPILIPTKEEINSIIKKYSKDSLVTAENLPKVREEISKIISGKINAYNSHVEFLNSEKTKVLEALFNNIGSNKTSVVTESCIKKLSDFAKVLGEFKNNQKVLDACKLFKVEEVEDSIIARTWDKFEKTLIKELNIKYKDLKNIRNSEEYAKEILDKKLLELTKNPAQYDKVMEKLGKIISDMEVKLHGNSEVESKMADLINAIEDNYNTFAKRLNKIGGFDSTVNQAVKEHSDDLFTSLRKSGSAREDVFRFLDGTRETLNKMQGLDYVRENARGIGSSKHNAVTRIVDRYSGAKNSMHRILHTMDVYKRAEAPLKFVNSTYDRFTKEYSEQIAKTGKEILLTGTSAEHTLKHGISNPEFYQDIMRTIWAGDEVNVLGKGTISEETSKILEKLDGLKDGKVKTRFQEYIQRFRILIGNNDIDFTKPNHILNDKQIQEYEKDAITRLSKFNEVAKTPVDFLKDAAGRRYGTQKWLRIIGGIFAGTVAIATLVQFSFGKIKKPNNIRKEGK